MSEEARRALPAWLAASLELALLVLVRPKGERVAGKREGEWVRTFPSGRPLTKITYAGGRKHGPAVRWYLHGARRWVGEYVEGAQTGEWFFFERDGRLDARRTGRYENGLRFSALRGFNDWR